MYSSTWFDAINMSSLLASVVVKLSMVSEGGSSLIGCRVLQDKPNKYKQQDGQVCVLT